MKISELLNEVNPHNYDSDVDYYAALNARPKSSGVRRHRASDTDSYGNSWSEEEAFRANQKRYAAAKKKAEREADHDRIATGTNEAATSGAISAANTAVGPVYKNKPVNAAKNKDGTVKNALDQKGTNLLTGGSIGKQAFIKR